MQHFDLIVIGGGASGIMASIIAARNHASVLILEHKDKVGKKILATGNGKCNYTNANMDLSFFHGDKSLLSLFDRFSMTDTVSFFHELGVCPKNKNGYYYPYNEQAASFLDAMVRELERLQVRVNTGTQISDIYQKKTEYIVETNTGKYSSRTLIFATGLLASPKLGSDGSAFPFIKNFGHHFKEMVPALCGFYCEGMRFKEVSGVRVEALLSVLVDDKEVEEEQGELQLTDYGISGIPVFQISHTIAYALAHKKNISVCIRFLPGFTREALLEELHFRKENGNGSDAYDLLNGLLPTKLIKPVLVKAGVDNKKSMQMISSQDINQIVNAIQKVEVKPVKVRDYEYAQVCAGGIRTEEIDVQTLESKMVPNMFFCGELLDVDGICGGYNLQWAWTSGFVAGYQAAERIKND